jgi:hypothetical protein
MYHKCVEELVMCFSSGASPRIISLRQRHFYRKECGGEKGSGEFSQTAGASTATSSMKLQSICPWEVADVSILRCIIGDVSTSTIKPPERQ